MVQTKARTGLRSPKSIQVMVMISSTIAGQLASGLSAFDLRLPGRDVEIVDDSSPAPPRTRRLRPRAC